MLKPFARALLEENGNYDVTGASFSSIEIIIIIIIIIIMIVLVLFL